LHEVVGRDDVIMLYETSERQAADVFTKGFTNPEKWTHATELINVFSPRTLEAIRVVGGKKKPGLSFTVPSQVATIPEEDNVACTAVCPGLAGTSGPVASPGLAGAGGPCDSSLRDKKYPVRIIKKFTTRWTF
jgi:hypothetical protein